MSEPATSDRITLDLIRDTYMEAAQETLDRGGSKLKAHMEGTVAAAVLLAFFEGIMASFTDPTVARIGSLCLMSAVLLVRPHGIFAGATR